MLGHVIGPTLHRRALVLVLSTTVVLGLACGNFEQSPGAGDGGGGASSASSPYLGTVNSDEPPQLGGSLVYGLPAETNSWNPGLAQWGAYSFQVARALFDPLFLYDIDGNIQNNVVAKTEHNADYTEWTTTIRPNIKFHNGRPLTAQDVVDSNRTYRASPVLGGAFNLTTLESSEVLDELTYRHHTRKPWPTYRQSSTSQLGFIVDPNWLKLTADEDLRHPIGTGPFRLEKWEPGKSMTLVRNPDYWRIDQRGNRMPYLDRLEFRIIPSDRERANALKAGSIDVMQQVITTPDLLPLREECKAGRLQCFSDEKGETPEDLVVLNTTSPPLNSLDARRALAMAIDRDDYVKQVTDGLNEPADSMFAPSSPWYTPTAYPNYNPTEAHRLAERVKVRNKGLFKFELIAGQSEEQAKVAQYLAAAWRKVGIDVDVTFLENSKKIIKQVTGEYQASITQLFESLHPSGMSANLDPSQAGTKFTMVFSRLNDPEIGNRIEDLIRAEPNDSAWRAATARLVERVNIMVPFIWLDHAPRNVVARPNVVNITRFTLPDGMLGKDFHGGSHSLAQVWIKR
jgi:peptide/nickel transport system substrate-binding protein